MAIIKATIFLEKRFWVGTFERTDKEGYTVARHIFGAEPSDAEVYEFVINHYHELKFGEAKEISIQIQRMNPKRVQREVRREMAKIKETTTHPSTLAQDYMREEIEKKKKAKKAITSAEKQARKENQFALKQEKKKEKHRGH